MSNDLSQSFGVDISKRASVAMFTLPGSPPAVHQHHQRPQGIDLMTWTMQVQKVAYEATGTCQRTLEAAPIHVPCVKPNP